jgi:hypothetical protein
VRPGRRALLFAGLALAAAVVLALLAAAVRGVAGDTRADEQRLAYEVADPERDAHSRGPGTQVGEAMLGVADYRSLQDAVMLTRASRSRQISDTAAIARRGQAEAILGRIVREDGDPVLRSRAANLLGTLFFEDAKATRGNPRRLLELSLGAFQDAVLFDPRNEVAKGNLELLATLPANTLLREGRQGSDSSATPVLESGY